MKMETNFFGRFLIQARPQDKVLAQPTTFLKAVPVQQRSIQPPRYPLSRIDDLLGDFSEQTGANFG